MKQGLPTVLYGGDYNPDQWPETDWDDDIKVFKQADINSATINVFSWALLEPREGEYDFEKLDHIVAKLSQADFKIVMATSTAAMPAWMFKKYPDVARVDYQGRRHVFGQRHNFCPSSPNYRRLAGRLVDQLARRYAGNSHIVAWHVNNEYGGNCYCENCRRAFQEWLKQRYQTLDNLNQAWDNNVWSHTIYDWDEIQVPNELGDAWGAEGTHTIVAGLSVDYLRFQSDAMLSLYNLEKQTIEKYDKQTPILTNFHGTPNKWIDYHAWAKDQDIIAYDSYPAYDDPAYVAAFRYDLMRGLKHQPFMLMESTPSQVNWQPYSPLKRPNQMRATELQAVAHGADTVQYFQLKQAVGGSEKFHGAVISHSQRTDTRAFQEVARSSARRSCWTSTAGACRAAFWSGTTRSRTQRDAPSRAYPRSSSIGRIPTPSMCRTRGTRCARSWWCLPSTPKNARAAAIEAILTPYARGETLRGRELVKKVFLTSSQTRPTSLGSRLKRLRLAAAHSLRSHVCEPRSIFADVHAAGKNVLHSICACGRKLCEAFSTD